MELNDTSVGGGLFLSSIHKVDPKQKTWEFPYARSKNPNSARLSQAICKAYRADQTILTSSGTSATSLCIQALLERESDLKSKIIHDSEIYTGARKLFRSFSKMSSVEEIDFAKLDLVRQRISELKDQKLDDGNVIIFTESCSNPSGRIIDTRQIRAICEEHKMKFVLVVDNSWMSVALNPLDFGADIIVESLCKYMGDGNAMGGAIIGRSNSEKMEKVAAYIKLHGDRMSQFDCYQIEQKMATLSFRLEKAGDNALKVAQFLEEQSFIAAVNYPLLKSSPSFLESKTYMPRHGPGVLSFTILMSEKKCRRMIASSEKIICATSYGKSHTLFDPYSHSFQMAPKEPKGPKAPKVHRGNHVRLALGYGDSADEIIEELKRLFGLFVAV
jgi:cystathionine beta-lyase/cystathionine gamma-synthase